MPRRSRSSAIRAAACLPGRSQSIITTTVRPSSAVAHSDRQAFAPGTAIAGRPAERAASMSLGPSTSSTGSSRVQAGSGSSPKRVPGIAATLGRLCAVQSQPEQPLQHGVPAPIRGRRRPPDRHGDPLAVEPDLEVNERAPAPASFTRQASEQRG